VRTAVGERPHALNRPGAAISARRLPGEAALAPRLLGRRLGIMDEEVVMLKNPAVETVWQKNARNVHPKLPSQP
jgi:hypothetical protein